MDEEHRLRSGVQSGKIDSEAEHARLKAVEEELDQYWDLLRRRRSARDNNADPDAVQPRSVGEVEGYWQ